MKEKIFMEAFVSSPIVREQYHTISKVKVFPLLLSIHSKCNKQSMGRIGHNKLLMTSEFNQFHFDLLPSSSLLLSSSDFDSVTKTFEPQVNAPALLAFVIIAFIFSLLQIRINQVRDASVRRAKALAFLRQVKSEQLDLTLFRTKDNDETNNNTIVTIEERVMKAIKSYEDALKEELRLRTILPGVRIVAPNDAARREEDILAAKQFLNWDIEKDDNSVIVLNNNNRQNMENNGDKTKLLMQSRRRFDGKEDQINTSSTADEGPLSAGANAILLTVTLSQIALLVLLSLDPMSADNLFTNISSNP